MRVALQLDIHQRVRVGFLILLGVGGLCGCAPYGAPAVIQQGSDGWVIGVQLKSGAATDILDWREYHAQANIR